MAFSPRLLSLMISQNLSADEHLIAEHLISCSGLEAILQTVDKADIVMLPMTDLPGTVLSRFHLEPAETVAHFPIKPIGIMSASVALSSEFSARSVCSLLKKIFPNKTVVLKGVICIQSGVTINNQLTPGPLIWKLKECDGLTFSVTSLKFVISAAFSDAFTMSTVSSVKTFIQEGLHEQLTPLQLVEKAMRLIDVQVSEGPQPWSPRSMIDEIIPGAYQSYLPSVV